MYDGYVFLCTNISRQQCISNKRYTSSDEANQPPSGVKEGSIIFLYNPEDKSLLGPFTALTSGGDELDAGAWAEEVDEHVPSEDLKVNWENLHIVEHADEKLPFLREAKTCRLTSLETQNALDVLKGGRLYLLQEEA
jgi:hypothetical protein